MPLPAIIITTAVHCAIQSGGKWPPYRSLHRYLKHRHARDAPVVAFWWTNRQRIVSIASPDAFKASTKLLIAQVHPDVTSSHPCFTCSFPKATHGGVITVRRYIGACPSPCCVQARCDYCVRCPYLMNVSSYTLLLPIYLGRPLMWPSIAGTLAHTVATALHLSQAREVEQLRGTQPEGRGCRQGHC